MKKFLKPLLLGVVILLGLGFAKNMIVQSAITGVISKAANVSAHIGSTDASFLRSYISLKNVRLDSPRSFRERRMLDMPELTIDFDPSSLSKGIVHLEEVRLNVRELVVVRGKDGRTNVEALKPKEGSSKRTQKSRSDSKLHIDRLYLTIGSVKYIDHSMGGEPIVQTFDIGIRDRVYHDIDDPASVVSLIMFESLTRTSLARLANLDVGVFKDGASGVLNQGFGALSGGTDQIESTAKGLLSLFK